MHAIVHLHWHRLWYRVVCTFGGLRLSSTACRRFELRKRGGSPVLLDEICGRLGASCRVVCSRGEGSGCGASPAKALLGFGWPGCEQCWQLLEGVSWVVACACERLAQQAAAGCASASRSVGRWPFRQMNMRLASFTSCLARNCPSVLVKCSRSAPQFLTCWGLWSALACCLLQRQPQRLDRTSRPLHLRTVGWRSAGLPCPECSESSCKLERGALKQPATASSSRCALRGPFSGSIFVAQTILRACVPQSFQTPATPGNRARDRKWREHSRGQQVDPDNVSDMRNSAGIA